MKKVPIIVLTIIEFLLIVSFFIIVILEINMYTSFLNNKNIFIENLLKEKSFQQILKHSKIILFLEFIIITIIGIIIIKQLNKNKKRKEILNLKEIHKNKNSTELDVLYAILKNKKEIAFDCIEETFKVDKEIVKIWANTLENNGLAKIVYPHFGKPTLRYIEKNSENEKE